MPCILHTTPLPSLQIGLWKITEDQSFFSVPAARHIEHPHKRLQHLAARHLLQTMAPQFAWNKLYVMPTGKPIFPSHQPAFSVSHCGDFAAVALLNEGSVGIDVEKVTERMHRLKHKFLHATETRWVNSLPPSQQARVLTQIWSAKEALFKWWGHGGVDFSEHLRLMPFAVEKETVAQVAFLHPHYQTALELRLIVLEEEALTLTWLATAEHP
jgi:phosphopantetheine--protein transferase-like protein